MSTDEIKNLVQLYFDGELDKKKQPQLFALLSQNEEARIYLEQLQFLRNTTEESIENFPAVLDERILNSIKSAERKSIPSIFNLKTTHAFAFAAAVIMLVLSLFLFIELNNYKNKVELISEQVNAQKQTIDLILYNSLPPVEVRSKSIKEIIIKSN